MTAILKATLGSLAIGTTLLAMPWNGLEIMAVPFQVVQDQLETQRTDYMEVRGLLISHLSFLYAKKRLYILE